MKVCIAAHQTESLVNFRGELIRALIAQGHSVICTAPEPDEGGALAALGARFVQIPFSRTGTNPLSDLRLMRAYRGFFERERPQVLLTYAIKPNVYAPRQARRAGVGTVVSIVEGMGTVFSPQASARGKLASAVGKALYRRSMPYCDRVLFLNEDSRAVFLRGGFVAEQQAVYVPGTGINMQHYAPMPLPERPAFLMIARLIREKGVMEYAQAARMLRQSGTDAPCYLLGPFEPRAGALTAADIAPYRQDGSIVYLGEVRDVRPVIAKASVLVLPSDYPEGLPRSLQEGMACGRAIVTTDTPGCRDLVDDEKNGLLVPPRDAQALAQAMQTLAADGDLVRRMGQQGIAICAQRYEVSRINRAMMGAMGLGDGD